ncbi:hypothetical protein [Aeromonas hydrophila]|uniref:hypothetical protein n=1 Tax=Aeromonas hydrophila TaxID=644 RepID=UPI0023607F3B|nr:hypothetical protein [Aeromonas hydrophila]
MKDFYTPPASNSNDAEAQVFMFSQLMNGLFFIELVQVMKVSGTAPNLVVDVLPLVTQRDHTGAMINNSPVYNVPVFRLQRGTSAVIMDPVVGDIGAILVCDKDNSGARANRKPSLPGTDRSHSKSDALYIGGFLNGNPTEYAQFTGTGINIKSPGTVNINGLKILPDGKLQLVDGSIVDGHKHAGITRGGAQTDPLAP